MGRHDSVVATMRNHPRFAWLAFVVVAMFTTLPFQACGACCWAQAAEAAASDAHHPGHGMRSLPPCCADAVALVTAFAVPRASTPCGPLGFAPSAFRIVAPAYASGPTGFAEALLPARSYCERSRRLLR